MEAALVQLLNALVEMQKDSAYAANHGVLMQAESVIISLEQNNAHLTDALNKLLSMPDYDRKATTSKIRREAKRNARIVLKDFGAVSV